MTIQPVILAGGQGSRLWPLSHSKQPKQFIPFENGQSLYQLTLKRAAQLTQKPAIILTTAEQLCVAESQNSKQSLYLCEPTGRNTAAPICLTALYQEEHCPDSTLIFMPADHYINDTNGFNRILREASQTLDDKTLALIGIQPDRPETGYGWIEISPNSLDVKGFIEKPELKKAISLFRRDTHYWNSGIVIAKPNAIKMAFQEHLPETYELCELALKRSKRKQNALFLPHTEWEQLPNISMDHAILEKAKHLKLFPFGGSWSDLGDWKSVLQHTQNPAPFQQKGECMELGCQDTLLINSQPHIRLIGLGLKDIIAVSTKDGILIAHKDYSQEVKHLANLNPA